MISIFICCFVSITALFLFFSYFARETKTLFVIFGSWGIFLMAFYLSAALIKSPGYREVIGMAGLGFSPLFLNLAVAKAARILKINEEVGLLAGGGVIALVSLLVFSPGGRLHMEWIGLVMWLCPVAIVFSQLRKAHGRRSKIHGEKK